jgi:hypothetical protein
MGFVSNAFRKIVFWNYPRTSWQWDVLCVLCLVFIFLTPKSWFASSPPTQTQTTVVWATDLVGSQADTPEITRQITWRARERVNRPEGKVLRIDPRKDDSGKVIAYEVDIR